MANASAGNHCATDEQPISDLARHHQLVDCLNIMRSQNEEIVKLLERVAQERESQRGNR